MKNEGSNDRISNSSGYAARHRWVCVGLLAIAFWLLAVLAVGSLYQREAGDVGFDFYQFWVGGDIIRHSHARDRHEVLDIYSDAAFHDLGSQYRALAQTHSSRQRHAAALWPVLETLSSPFFYWVFSVLTPGDYDIVYRIYIIFSLTCLVAGIALLAWRLKYPFAGMGLAVGLAAMSAPVASDFHVTNVNCPEFLVCTVYLLLRDIGRRGGRFSLCAFVVAGGIMGLLIPFKPNLLFPLVLLGLSGLMKRGWRRVIAEGTGFLVAFVGAIGVSSWSFGSYRVWITWARAIRALTSIPSKLSDYGNFSLTETVYEHTGKNITGILLASLIALAAAAIWRARNSLHARRRASSDIDLWDDVSVFGIGTAVTFLCSGLAWVHYPVLIFPFLMLLGSPAYRCRIGLAENIARWALLTIITVLFMIPAPEGILSLLPFHVNAPAWTWIYCTQAAIVLVLCAGLWFEARLLPRMKPV